MMDRRAAKESMVCFANYLAMWADHYDDAGFFEAADAVTNIAMHLAKEAKQITEERDDNHHQERTA